MLFRSYKLDSPLRSNGSLAIGYGAAGWPPISFSLPAGQDVDLGFLKIFLSTSPSDLSDICQPSFPGPDPPDNGYRKAKAVPFDMPPPIQDPTSSWGTVIIPIRQRLPHVPPLPPTGVKYTKTHVDEDSRLTHETSKRHEEEIATLREEIAKLKSLLL